MKGGERMAELTASERVAIARNPHRPKTMDYIEAMFTDFMELKGDRLFGEDESIVGGIGRFYGVPVTVLGQRKGRNTEENMRYNFGMPQPEGYRKSQRLAKQAEKFGRPIICFIDTPGAYPGMEAEERGQGQAIAENIALFSQLSVPVISVVIGEGGSGGALALGVADEVLMLENSIYAILSPEGFASILWRDSSKSDMACEVMKLTAPDLYSLGVIDGIIKEPEGGAHTDPAKVIHALDREIAARLEELMKKSPKALVQKRYEKFRRMGNTKG
jgi:acetyl-CoA carboxylase carboxyl transferase subunit alpha